MGTTPSSLPLSAAVTRSFQDCVAFETRLLLPWASLVNVSWSFAADASLKMLDAVHVSFSSSAGGANYMAWQEAHVTRQLTVSNSGIRDNRPFYVNVRTKSKVNLEAMITLGPVLMTHRPPKAGSASCSRSVATGDWSIEADRALIRTTTCIDIMLPYELAIKLL
jgi:hypothetical protein